jgi:predicted transcriptional regulator
LTIGCLLFTLKLIKIASLSLEFMSPFSHFLHELRLQHQIRQSELAELLGYEQSYISALEVGIKGPPTESPRPL